MQPASLSDLSFHSSSDYSVRPIYLNENMSAVSSDPSQAYGSDAFRTARSANTLSPTAAATSAPTPRPAPEVPLSRQVSTALTPRSRAPSNPALQRGGSYGGSNPSASSSHPHLRSPTSRRFTSAGTPYTPPEQREYPTEPPRPQPPAALPRRAKNAAAVSPPPPPTQPPSGNHRHSASKRSADNSNQNNNNRSDPNASSAGNGGGGWWGSAVQAFARGRERVNEYVDTLTDPNPSASRKKRSTTVNAGNSARSDATTASSGFGGLFDDLGHSPFHDDSQGDPYSLADNEDRLRAARVHVEDTGEPFAPLLPMAHPIPEVTEEEQLLDEATDVDAEPPTIEVDLVSALHGYCANPNEAYGHLVAAALTSRSPERPVTGAEVAEAQHNPFLVRMIVASGCLDYNDPVTQRNVQETLDSIMPEGQTEFTPTLYEYLETFFEMPFIRLSHGRYVMLKSSGFENIALMHANPHVLPEERLHSITLNYSPSMSLTNFIFVVISLLASTTCTVAIALVLAGWMTIDAPGYQSYGFYTLIAYGCGYALHLIFMVYFMRTREDENRYEDTQGMHIPSPYVNVFPILPIFEVLCVVRYARARGRNMLAYPHNVLVSSRLASICYAFCFGFPQYVVQSYFSYTSRLVDPKYQRQWSFYFLAVTALVQWGIALIRFCYMMIAYDSTSSLGFACFNIPRIRHAIERHSGVSKILYYLLVFQLEVGVYIVVAAGIEFGNIDECIFLPTCVISLAGVLMLIILIVYIVMIFQEDVLVRLSFASIPICAIVVAINVLGAAPGTPACVAFRHVVFGKSFIFGYIANGVFFVVFFVWMVMIVFVVLMKLCNVKLFPRLTGPLVRAGRTDEENPAETKERPTEGDGAVGEDLGEETPSTNP